MPDVGIVNYATSYVPTTAVTAGQQSALALVSQLLQLQHVSERHLTELLSIGLWKWTEAAGVAPYAKFNLRYVSGGVLHPDGPVSINHEHVWPRRWLIQRLRAKTTWSAEGLSEFLNTYGVACVVTVQEHALLGGVGPGEGWQRYRKAGIAVWDRQRGDYREAGSDEWSLTGRRAGCRPPPGSGSAGSHRPEGDYARGRQASQAPPNGEVRIGNRDHFGGQVGRGEQLFPYPRQPDQ